MATLYLPCLRQHRAVTRLDDVMFGALLAMAKRLSGRTIFVACWATYLGIGLAMPLVLAWPVPLLVLANLVAATFAGLFGLFWFRRAVSRRQRPASCGMDHRPSAARQRGVRVVC
jgi:hypothetical protein